MSIMDGLSTGSGQSDADAAWERAEAKIDGRASAAPEAAPEQRESASPWADSAADVRRGLLDGSPNGASVAAGLTTSDPRESASALEDEARIEAARRAALSDPDRVALYEEAERADAVQAELSALREDAAVDAFVNGQLEGQDLVEGLVALRGTGVVSEDRFYETIARAVGFEPGADDIEDWQMESFHDVLDEVERRVATVEQAMQQNLAVALARTEAAEDRATRTQALLSWAHSRGFDSQEQAIARATEVEAFAASMGVDLSRVPAERYGSEFSKYDVLMQEGAREAQVAAWKQREFFGESTSVSEGIEVFGPNGWQRPHDVRLSPNFGRAIDRVQAAGDPANRTTVGDMKRAMLDEGAMSAEYRRVQAQASEMFAEARGEKARAK